VTGFLDIRGAAEFLSRSPRWIRGHLGEIPHYRPGGQILFDADDLKKWMSRFRVEPKPPVDLPAILERVSPAPSRRRQRKGAAG